MYRSRTTIEEIPEHPFDAAYYRLVAFFSIKAGTKTEKVAQALEMEVSDIQKYERSSLKQKEVE